MAQMNELQTFFAPFVNALKKTKWEMIALLSHTRRQYCDCDIESKTLNMQKLQRTKIHFFT